MSNLNELKPIINLNPFARFCCTIGNLPSSYMASLTYEEQLMWFCDYLQNTVIPAVNNNAECVKELQELYVKLKNYVDNYFENLDVQEEINNKLDKMAEDGQLTNIIKPYVQELENIVDNYKSNTDIQLNNQNNNINDFKNSIQTQIAVQNNKINSIEATEPTIVNSIEEMTDVNKIYILSSNMHIYVGKTDTGVIYGSSSNNLFGYGSQLGSISMERDFDNNFNNLVGNKIYTIVSNSSKYLNAPSSDFIGTIIAYNYNSNESAGLVQIAIDLNNKIYHRIMWGSIPTWSNWTEINLNNSVKGFKHFLNEQYWLNYENDCNNLLGNNIYTITYNTNILNLPKNNFIGTLISFASNSNNALATIQIAVDNYNNMFYRINWGSTPTWSNWLQMATNSQIKDLQNQINSTLVIPNLFSSFKNVGCIGDSLASGECSTSSGQLIDLYEFSWGQFMAKLTNCNYYNFSKGGLTTKSWLTDEKGLPLATDGNHKCEAYIIGLGVNDYNQGLNIGTVEDIKENFAENPDTFYGNYGRIIQNLKLLYPKAKFFLLTSPLFMDNQNYNVAIRNIAEHFDNCYLIDLYEDREKYTSGFLYEQIRDGHYNAIGYNYMSKLLLDKLNNYIYNNYEEFSRIEFINTDYN